MPPTTRYWGPTCSTPPPSLAKVEAWAAYSAACIVHTHVPYPNVDIAPDEGTVSVSVATPVETRIALPLE